MPKVYLTEKQVQDDLDFLSKAIDQIEEASVWADGFEGGVQMFSYELKVDGYFGGIMGGPTGGEALSLSLAQNLKQMLNAGDQSVFGQLINARFEI